MTDVVVVESPAKAKTINKYLGGDFTVLASFGHVRDLPAEGRLGPAGARTSPWTGRRTTAARSRSAPSPRR